MASKTRRPLTLRDVSEASGVSEMTVSRVLRGREEVSPGTRERVLAAARALGYVPNKIAGGLASQRVNLVGVIVPSLSNLVFPEVLAAIADELEDTGLQPVFGISRYSAEREENVLYEMLSWRPSGIILAGLEHTDLSRAMLAKAGVPVVEIMDVDGEGIDSVVGISHRAAGRMIADAVVAAGYRRIGFLGTKMPDDHRARKRLEGLQAGLAAHGLAVLATEHYEGGSSLAKGREMTQAILAQCPDLDCLVYSNDMIGVGGLLWLMERGVDIPNEIGLVGFNGLEIRAGVQKRLASVDACRREIGRIAAQIIAGKHSALAAPQTTVGGHRIVLEPRLDPGDTLRPFV